MSQFHESLQLTGGKAQSSEPGSVQAASNSHEGHDLALVLGGGGAAGNAWQIGVIAGLAEGGLDLTVRADLVVGTSAGATTAALVRSNIPPAELLASVLSPSAPPVGRSPERTPSIPMATVFERMRTISAAAISAAAVAASATATAAATGTCFAGLGLIDGQGAALELSAVERLDRGLRSVAHFDKAETSRTTRFAVGRDLGAANRAVVREQLFQIFGRRGEGKIANIQIHQSSSKVALIPRRRASEKGTNEERAWGMAQGRFLWQ
jgi:hypothetical protein